MIDMLNRIFLNLIDFSSSIRIKCGSRCTSISFCINWHSFMTISIWHNEHTINTMNTCSCRAAREWKKKKEKPNKMAKSSMKHVKHGVNLSGFARQFLTLHWTYCNFPDLKCRWRRTVKWFRRCVAKRPNSCITCLCCVHPYFSHVSACARSIFYNKWQL